MYLSTKKCFELDEVIKSFEVAYRSFIADEMLNNYPSISDFSVAINGINDSFETSTLILSRKYKSKILKIKNEVASAYKKLQDCRLSYQTTDYDNDVPYVSEIIDYVFFFFNSCFSSLASSFTSVEEFKDYSTKYLSIRNTLSHPASSKIQISNAKEVASYIRKLVNILHSSYFWYVSKKDIITKLENFVRYIDEIPLEYHNLGEVAFSHNKIVCREKEIKKLNELIFGQTEFARRSGSIVVFGYGGVGKTAIVLEFLYRTIKSLFDGTLNTPIEFILFYTSKDEILSITQTNQDIYIEEINKQISSYDDFKSKILSDLKLNSIDELQEKKGIIVIDNLETIKDNDKSLFMQLVKSLPRSIQFIFTSRNEEQGEDKINLKEFSDISAGVNFIDEFVNINDFKINLQEETKKDLVRFSKGNTLVLVLSIHFINYGLNIDSILSDLKNVESSNIEVIVDFMYKNSINNTINDLEKDGYSPVDILKVISLYGVAADLYSLSFLSNQEISSVEYICKVLAKNLILEKIGEAYKPNEFANKFILSKYIPHNIEKKEIRDKVKEYKSELSKKLNQLDEQKRKQPLLSGILDDWQPRNSIDIIAITEAFLIYGDSKDACAKANIDKITKIRREFVRIEKMTSHPYIKFQKARCHELFLDVFKKEKDQTKIKKIMSECYEAAIESTDFYYPYIKNTKSYGSINWIYGLFLSSSLNDKEKALRYVEDAIEIFDKIDLRDKVYFTAANNLSWLYLKMYKEKEDTRYLSELERIYKLILSYKEIHKNIFDFGLYKRTFGKYVTGPANKRS